MIVVGPGLGYISREVQSGYPTTRVISLHLARELLEAATREGEKRSAAESWSPDSAESLDSLLDRTLGELDTVAVSVLEWSPVVDAFPEVSTHVRDVVAATIRRRHGSLLTEGAVGRRWFRNMMANFVTRDTAYTLAARSGESAAAVVIAAAGPSLEEALPTVAKHRARIKLWSTASALAPMVAFGLSPDLVVVTDAAFYASEHLREVITGGCGSVPVCAPLTATRGLHDVRRLAICAQHDPLETLLLQESRADVVSVPPNGTVTGSALDLASSLSGLPLVFAGLDAAWKGQLSHARPHIAHTYREQGSNRFAPALSATYKRTIGFDALPNGWCSDRTLLTYTDWFRSRANGVDGFYRMAPSPVDMGMHSISASQLSSLPIGHESPGVHQIPWPGVEGRKAAARTVGDRCVRCLHNLSPAAVRSPIFATEDDAVAVALLRRFELPALVKWYRDRDDEASIREMSESTIDEVESVIRDVT